MEIVLTASQFAKTAKRGSSPDLWKRDHRQMRMEKSFHLVQQKKPEKQESKSFMDLNE